MTVTSSRRSLLRTGALGGGAVAGALSLRAVTPSAWATPTASSEAALSAATGCTTLTQEETQGPFWVDERLNRSDIRPDSGTGAVQAGVPLTLTIRLTDASASCSPQVGAYVDIWHANAQGAYSDVSGSGNPNNIGVDWLRGYQVSDGDGEVTFTTVYPGWYVSRAIHIHFRVRLSLDSSTALNFTSQLFFDEAVTTTVLQDSRYKADSSQRTQNSTDSIYDAGLLVPLTGSASSGYAGTFTVNLSFGDGTDDSTTDTGADEVVDARMSDASVVRRRGKRVVLVDLKAKETVAGKLRLVRDDDVLAKRHYGWLTKGRRRLRLVVPSSVPGGRAVVQLNLVDAAGNSLVSRRRVQVPARRT